MKTSASQLSPLPANVIYPVRDGHRTHYVQYPVRKKNGKWVAADVLLPTGYLKVENNHVKVEHETEVECQKGCDGHNRWLAKSEGWHSSIPAKIIELSFAGSVSIDQHSNKPKKKKKPAVKQSA